MKAHITSALALGTVFVVGSSQPASAIVTQPINPIAQQENVTNAYWYGRHHRGWGGRHHWNRHYWGGRGYRCPVVCNHWGCHRRCY